MKAFGRLWELLAASESFWQRHRAFCSTQRAFVSVRELFVAHPESFWQCYESFVLQRRELLAASESFWQLLESYWQCHESFFFTASRAFWLLGALWELLAVLWELLAALWEPLAVIRQLLAASKHLSISRFQASLRVFLFMYIYDILQDKLNLRLTSKLLKRRVEEHNENMLFVTARSIQDLKRILQLSGVKGMGV